MVANESTIKKIEEYPNVPKKPISNIPFYWLLANPEYQHKFNYFTVALPNRSEYIEDGDSDEGNDCEQSDFVYIMLNLAYLKYDHAMDIELKKGFAVNGFHARGIKYATLHTRRERQMSLKITDDSFKELRKSQID